MALSTTIAEIWSQTTDQNPSLLVLAILVFYTRRPIALPAFFYMMHAMNVLPTVLSMVANFPFDTLSSESYVQIDSARCTGNVDYQPWWPYFHPAEQCSGQSTIKLSISALVIASIVASAWTTYGIYILYGKATKLAKEMTVDMVVGSIRFAKECARDIYDKVMSMISNVLLRR